MSKGRESMYWICFGDSAKGCLAMARNVLEPSFDVEHILALSDDYAQGDIRDVTDRAARADILMPWRDDPELDGTWREDYQAQHWRTLDRLDEVDEAVIWYAGGNALEQCGLRYVVGRLRQRKIPVWAVEVGWMPACELSRKAPRADRRAASVGVVTGSRVRNALLRWLPQFIVRRYAVSLERRSLEERQKRSPREGMIYFSTVGEVSPDILPYFYKRRRQLTETEQAALLTEWKRMQEENMPLRAMVNGRVQSVSAEYYDETILSCVPEEESQAALTVGRALAKLDETGNRVSDMLIFSRIRALGTAGRLIIVRDGATYRDMTIRKIGG